jgi:hypothetical protein
LKDQLKLLEELQRHDAKLLELEAARKAIPEKLDSMRRDLSKIEELLGREKAELEEAERWRRERDVELSSQDAMLSKTKQKLSGVKNTKEYMAAQREAETLRKLSVETQEKLAQVVEAGDKKKQQIEAHSGDVAKLREMVEREESTAKERLGSIDGEIATLRAEREEAAKAVRADVLKKYNTIKMRRGLAVVAVHNGTCRGCNMNIPPQLYNQLQRMNTIEVCPNCHRMIYWDKLFENPPGDGQPTDSPELAGKEA